MKLEKAGRRKSSNRRGAATTISSNYDSLFVHRKNALYRRAAELSAITDCNIGIILLSPEGELSQFSTTPMKKVLRSYAKLCGMPHEIHTMESIQAKCIAAGGEGIGLRVSNNVGGLGSVEEEQPQVLEHPSFRDKTLQLSSQSQGKRGQRNKGKKEVESNGQAPWEADALEAILRMGKDGGAGGAEKRMDGEAKGKRKLEVKGEDDDEGMGGDEADDGDACVKTE